MRDHEALTTAAAAAGGLFSRKAAIESGWTPKAIHEEVVERRWHRLERGVYVDAAWYRGLPPRARHLVDLRARLLVRDKGWHASGLTAAIVHGLPLLGQVPNAPTLVRDRGAPTERGYLTTERVASLPPSDRVVVGDLKATSLARTVFDVARSEPLRAAVVVADAALGSGLGVGELDALLARCRGWPGAIAAGEALALADGRAESVLESISRLAFRDLALPMPEPQVEVWHQGRLVARVDFLWRDHLVVGEADGRVKYEDVSSLYAEKRREERLRDLGLEVVRWGWDDAFEVSPDLGVAVRRSLARGALNTLADGVVLRSTGVRRVAA